MKLTTVLGLLVCGLPLFSADQAHAQTGQLGGAPRQAQSIPIDLVFCFDTSASMAPYLNRAKGLASTVLQGFRKYASQGDLRVGLLEYSKEKTNDDPVYDATPLTAELVEAQNKLAGVHPGGGSTEPVGEVVGEVTSKMTWRTGAYKAVYFLGNETAAQGNVDYRTTVRLASAKGLHINTIYYGYQEELTPNLDKTKQRVNPAIWTWVEIANLGNGHFFLDNPDDWPSLMAGAKSKDVVEAQVLQNANAFFADQLGAQYAQVLTTYLPYDGSTIQRRGYATMTEINLRLGGHMPQSLWNLDFMNPILEELHRDNSDWDLVDAARQNAPLDWDQVDEAKLPPEMRRMNSEERNDYVAFMLQRRDSLLDKATQIEQLWVARLQRGHLPSPTKVAQGTGTR